MRAVRWIAAFRWRGHVTPAAIAASLDWEASEGSLRERAAEPLWRGRSAMGWRSAGVGLVYHQTDIARAYSRDAWSEVRPGGRLERHRAGRLRAWRDVHAFSRHWERNGGPGGDPYAHGEVWLRRGAQPLAVALLPGVSSDIAEAAKAWAAARGLRVIGVEGLG